MDEQVTIMPPDSQGPTARMSSGVPVDLLRHSAERLRILALLYAFTFFMAGIFPALLDSEERARYFGSFLLWAPGVIGIGMAVLIAAVIRSGRVPLPTVMTIALAFEIVGSYAIAAAEFADPTSLETHRGYMGLSWVSVWTLLFTVVVPTSPRRAVAAALASVSSVAVVIGLVISIVGIPLLGAIPLALALGALAWTGGFAAVAACLGARLRGSSIANSSSLVADLLIGFLVIAALTIVAHVISLGPGWMTPFGWMTRTAGIAVEYVAWTIGLGAALSGRFVRSNGMPPPMPVPSTTF